MSITPPNIKVHDAMTTCTTQQIETLALNQAGPSTTTYMINTNNCME